MCCLIKYVSGTIYQHILFTNLLSIPFKEKKYNLCTPSSSYETTNDNGKGLVYCSVVGLVYFSIMLTKKELLLGERD